MKKALLVALIAMLLVLLVACSNTPNETGAAETQHPSATQKTETTDNRTADGEDGVTITVELGVAATSYTAYGRFVEADVHTLPSSPQYATAVFRGLDESGEPETKYGNDGCVTILVRTAELNRIGATSVQGKSFVRWTLPSGLYRAVMCPINDLHHPDCDYLVFIKELEPIEQIPEDWISQARTWNLG